jgi:DNA helicase-2/ATP-dependent DNA helicase PcrA
MATDTELNSEQQSAVTCNKATVIVPAGPGSGKSHTLVRRVVRRVADGVDPKRIVILTFTNNGARVFTERLIRKGIRVGFAGTLHGYCMRLIQDYGTLLGYRPGCVSIATDQAANLLLDQVKTELRKKLTDKELQARESNDAKLVWQEYEFRLKRSNMIDYDGILRDGLAILKRESVKQLVAIDELLVDERQDSGAIDSEIFWEIPAKTRFFVGDVDQCIFAFRGARPDLFVQEAEKYGYIALSKNYRSDKAICKAANNLIVHNENRVKKSIEPVSEEDGLVVVQSFDHDGDEIYGVWSQIKAESTKVRFNQMAVLCRTNAIADKFRETLRGLGVPVNGDRARKMPDDWSFTLSLVGLLVDPANDFHAEAILRARKWPDAKIADLKIIAAKESIYLSTAALLPNTRPATLNDAMIILNSLLSRESFTLVQSRVRALPANPTLSDLLVDLWRRDAWESETDEATDKLTVSTIHGAKGSEWDVVFVTGMEEGVFPSNQSLKTECEDMLTGIASKEPGIEEERRLCFVAVTRAKHRLYLTWAKKRTAFFKTTNQEPSRFIEEMEPIDTTGGYEIPAEERL